MIQSIRNLSVPEIKLLNAVRDLGFGEIFGADVPDAPCTLMMDLNEAEWKLVNWLRAGHTHIDVLSVHMGMPALAETDYEKDGFRCRKKTKFPT